MNQKYYINVGQRIREIREYFQDDQKTLAEKMGIAQPTLSDIERMAEPNMHRAFQVCEIYGIPPCELFSNPGDLDKYLPSWIEPKDAKVLRLINGFDKKTKFSIKSIMNEALTLSLRAAGYDLKELDETE